MNAGDTQVFVAVDTETTFYMSWRMQETPGFSEWVKQSIEDGYEVRDMTVAEMLAHLDEARSAGKKLKRKANK
jgi:hypothetical protein